MTLDFVEDSVWMRKLDLVAVSTLGLSNTGLPRDGGWAWRFVTGFDSQNLACRDCTLFKIEGGFGKSVLLFDRQIVYLMLDARAQTPTAGSGNFAGTPRIGAIFNWVPSSLLKSELNIGYRSYLEKQDADGAIIKFETSLSISRDWDIRAVYEKHVAEAYVLSISRYW